jgi:hypothetical protein
MVDRLSLTNALTAGNIEREAAERIATEIFDAIRETVATKADLAALEARLNHRIDELDHRIDLIEHRLMSRLGGLIVVIAGLLFAALHYWPPHG